ncbi:MAG: hypothetical protein LUI60_04240 [Clostridia bacterium]|nr:hypothetical protein [Clostridia bacterium]
MPRKTIVSEEKTNRPVRVVHVPSKPAVRHNRAKLLISIVNRGDDEALTELINDFSVALTFSVMGKGTARSAVLNYLGIGTSAKVVMLSVIPESDEAAILDSIKNKMELYLVGRGISFTVPLSVVSEIVAGGITSAAATKSVDGRKIMKDKDRTYDLIVAEVAAGYVDEAMEAARNAGAAGGTILNARSVNNAKAEQFIGISLREESDVLLILSRRSAKEAIMNAIMQSSGLKTEAGGILFSIPVDRTVGVGASGVDNKPAPDAPPTEQNV